MNRKKTITLAAAGCTTAAFGAINGGIFVSGFATGIALVLCIGAIVTYRQRA